MVFDVDADVVELYEKIIQCEQQLYEIKLVKTDTGYTILNAAQSLLDYVNDKLGGFDEDNVHVEPSLLPYSL